MQTFSHSRLNRLLSPADFERVFQQARRSSDRFFTVLWRPNNGPEPRIGFAISKKRIALAVARNRVRRIARESFRHHKPELGSVDIVVLAQNAAAKASNNNLSQSLANHWVRVGASSDASGSAAARNENG